MRRVGAVNENDSIEGIGGRTVGGTVTASAIGAPRLSKHNTLNGKDPRSKFMKFEKHILDSFSRSDIGDVTRGTFQAVRNSKLLALLLGQRSCRKVASLHPPCRRDGICQG